jgi:hypothetical protein
LALECRAAAWKARSAESEGRRRAVIDEKNFYETAKNDRQPLPHLDQEWPQDKAPPTPEKLLHPLTAQPGDKAKQRVDKEHPEDEHGAVEHRALGLARFGGVGQGNGNGRQRHRIKAKEKAGH